MDKDLIFKQKYEKYKLKYLNLKKQKGGALIEFGDVIAWDTTSVTQYEIPVGSGADRFNRIVTVIGEVHLPAHTTDILTIKNHVHRTKSPFYAAYTVGQIIERMNTNNTALLVELNPSNLAQPFVSINLTESLSIGMPTFGVDYREKFGSPFGYPIGKLYWMDESMIVDDLFKFLGYLQQFLLKQADFSVLRSKYDKSPKDIPSNFSPEDYEYISRVFIDIENDSEIIYDEIMKFIGAIRSIINSTYPFDTKTFDKLFSDITTSSIEDVDKQNLKDQFNKIIYMLMHTYKKLVDLYSVFTILDASNKEIVHYILLIGEEHASNIRTMLGRYITFIGPQEIKRAVQVPGTPNKENTTYVDITRLKYISS
jgi:hypothetical protein